MRLVKRKADVGMRVLVTAVVKRRWPRWRARPPSCAGAARAPLPHSVVPVAAACVARTVRRQRATTAPVTTSFLEKARTHMPSELQLDDATHHAQS
ncbi:hypothetical protein EVAR_58060_1 [Eumeta japonica]|uniref:Uncharacterized protein n=1 Tax=Eumeta variegata TaxID=151549 RepID=A0A4C1SQ27_EUMVA|nr:hypothetical protein EVAR_58060_1 [Eumeta japonica]